MVGLKDLLIQSGVAFHGEKIQIPSWRRRVKVDVGLSYNALQSSNWISADPNLIVFGFEPVTEYFNRLRENFSPYRDGPESSIENKQQLFIVPIALGDVCEPTMITMHITENDAGYS